LTVAKRKPIIGYHTIETRWMTDRNETLICQILASELDCQLQQVKAVLSLLEEGATIPFIARYRKEMTGGLDDIKLRKLDERLTYLRDFIARRDTIINTITTQGKLTPALTEKLMKATSKTELEDIYAPFKVKVKTRAQIAIENGLAPLVDMILSNQATKPEEFADAFVSDKVPAAQDALNGARDIIVERIADNVETVGKVREKLRKAAKVATRVVAGKELEGEKYKDYFAYEENWKDIPGHRALAVLRARAAGLLDLDLAQSEESVTDIKTGIAADNRLSLANPFLAKAVDWSWKVKLASRTASDLIAEMRERAETAAIDVFVRNMKALLLAAPAGGKTTMGLDPGVRTGIKVAVVDKTGKLLETAVVYPYPPQNDVSGALNTLRNLVLRHGVELIAIGNGTASRETDRLAGELLKRLEGKKVQKIIVNEAGASVYSASEIASREMPDVDVSLRGAVSIGRRLQDPLAELVKIEPKSIGVGQYQHDVDQSRLAKALSGAVEDAVNAVGVDLNTASPALLSHVAGLGPALANAIVDYRDSHGAFKSRQDLLKVPRLGEKAFRQCAGFLRIREGSEPLDASAVHPEAYDVARKIVASCGRNFDEVMGNPKLLDKLKPQQFITPEFGLPTVKDIIDELRKPGRDPRPEFKMAVLSDAVHEISDLKPGMKLEGTVTNVAAFGAFVDIGVHQDGLVHVSQLADKFVSDPNEVVKAGKIVKVTVLAVDLKAKKISLSMKSNPEYPDQKGQAPQQARSKSAALPLKDQGNSAMADALKRALNR
jgi:uncharacterized protein